MILVDFNNVSLACIFALSGEFGQAKDVESFTKMLRHAFLNTILSYKKKFSPEYGKNIIIACDAKGNWRKEFFPEYKANRKKNRDEGPFDWKFAFAAMDVLRDELKNIYPWPVIQVDQLEGDDIIAILAKRKKPEAAEDFFGSSGDGKTEKTLIISSDGDMKQLHSENIKQWSPMTKEYVKITNGWTIYEKIAKGDAGDGVPNMFSENKWFTQPTGKRAKPVTKKIIEQVTRDCRDKGGYDEKDYSRSVIENLARNQLMVDMNFIPEKFIPIVENQLDKYKFEGSKQKIYESLIAANATQLLHRIDEF